MPYAVLFPGQGSQFVGMGADLFAVRPDLLGRRADDILGWSLSALCADGPDDELTRTARAQPALFALAYALWEELSAVAGHPPVAAAGHSLGEYTAMAAAGMIDYESGLRLVAARGTAMDTAAGIEASGMVALLGVDLDAAERVAQTRRREGGRLYVANVNAPGQIVLAGGDDDIAWVVEEGSLHGVRRSVVLKVAGAFHSPLMATAAGELDAALGEVVFRPGDFPVYGNVSAAPLVDPRRQLVAQLTSTVRFADSLTAMAAAGVDMFVHVGPGEVTAGMARRTVPQASVVTVSQLDEVPAAAEVLSLQ